MIRRGATAVSLIAVVCASFTPNVLAQHHPVAQPAIQDVSVPAEGDSVPMLDFGGRPVVEVVLKGKGPFKFIIDTGASFTVIDSALADELSLEENPQIQEVRVGKVAVRNLRAVVNPISKFLGAGDVPRGVLNASSFPGAVVSFDYPGKQIIFRRGTLGDEDHKRVFGYDPADLPSLPVNAAGHEMTLHLDTGAPYAIALPTKYMKALPLSAPPVQKGVAKTHGGEAPIFVAALDGEISIGEFKLPSPELRFSDVVPFAGAEPKGQVGNEALRDSIVRLDSLNHRIMLDQPASKRDL